MNKRLEGYIRAGILFAWPLTWGGTALAQSVPGDSMAVPDVGSTGPVGASPSGSPSDTSEMQAPRDPGELERSHLPPDRRIPPVNPGGQPPLPGSPQVSPPDTLHPSPSAQPSGTVPSTPGAPRPGTANQTQGTPLPPDVVPRDAAAGQVRDVTPQSSRVKTSARRNAQRSGRATKKGRRVRQPQARPGNTSLKAPDGTGRTKTR
jgi:hypothetical protein